MDIDKVLISETWFIELLVNREKKVEPVEELFTILSDEGVEICITESCNNRAKHYSSVLGATNSTQEMASRLTVLHIDREAFQEARSYQSQFTYALEIVCAQRDQVSVILSDSCENFVDSSPVPVLSAQKLIDIWPFEKVFAQKQPVCRTGKKLTQSKEAVDMSRDKNTCNTYVLTVPSGVNPNVYYRYLQDSLIDIYDDWHR